MNRQYPKTKINLIILALLFIFFYPQATSAFTGKIEENKNPKLANYYLKWLINDSETMELSKYDLLVLDMEVQVNSRQNLIKLRQLNPDIIILAYISSEEIRNDITDNRDAKLRRKLFSQIKNDWWLKSASSSKLSSWPGTWLLNLTNQSPEVDGERWNTILPRFVKENILDTGLWDGVFYDNVWHDISWLNNSQIDINNDGYNEPIDEVNNQWIGGVETMLKTSRNLWGDNYIIMSNGSSFDGYQPYLNGIMFESFPTPWEKDGQWQGVIQSYFKAKELNRSPKLSIINSTSKDNQDYLKMRNGLISSLLVGAYFSFDYDITSHSQTWWYDEYNYDLGVPLNKAYRIDGSSENYPQGVWRRDFSNGVVYLNSYYEEKKVILPNRFQKLLANQDKIVNDGGLVDYLILGPGDGIFLKNIFGMYDVGLLNNLNYKVLNKNGNQIKDYIITNKNYKNFQRISLNEDGQAELNIKNNSADINGDGRLEKIADVKFGQSSAVNIFNNRLIASFYAYDKNYKCGVKIAMADIDGDGVTEIITVPAYGGPHLKIFDIYGRLERELFFASNNLRANYDIAVADVNGDNLKEILVASY